MAKVIHIHTNTTLNHFGFFKVCGYGLKLIFAFSLGVP